MNSSNAKKPSYGGLKSIVFIHKPSLLNNLSSITQRTISRFKGDYSKIKSLFIFLIILFITQETKAVDCTGKPAYYYNATWNVHY